MTSTPDRIAFVDHQVPSLPGGDYTLTVTQTISLDPQAFTTTRSFTVAGDRFTLAPAAVQALFPPPGSLGDHSAVLPHVVLTRSSLPWERSPDAPGSTVTGPAAPWLALLLFADAEQPEAKVLPLAEVAGTSPYLPAPHPESQQSPADRVTVIDVPRSVLADLLPARADLPYLAHLRRTGGPDGADVAVVVGTRLPPAGGSSTVHLVSLEERYRDPGGGGPPGFDLGPGGPDSLVRLVSLASWRFACLSEQETFGALVARLARGGSPLRLPDSGDPTAEPFLRQAYVPVRHRLRGGGRTVAWHRGPLVTGPPVTASVPVTTRTADSLLHYLPALGMFDVSYAAAWEIGRLLALRSPGFATELYEWKRRRDQNHKRTTSDPSDGHPLLVVDIDVTLPAGVTDWVTQLGTLRGVPFGYLVPDERMLPVETVRFFQLDQQWIRHLVDGAYSIGRINATDADLDTSHPLPLTFPPRSGALLRSDVVSGYPGLLVDGYADVAGRHGLPSPRTERLSADVLLCLFDGDLQRLDVHQQPEALHFAVEPGSDGRFDKALRGLGDDGAPGPVLPPMPLGPRRTVPVTGLVQAMTTALGVTRDVFGPGAFARQMIETGDRVSFLRTGAVGP